MSVCLSVLLYDGPQGTSGLQLEVFVLSVFLSVCLSVLLYDGPQGTSGLQLEVF